MKNGTESPSEFPAAEKTQPQNGTGQKGGQSLHLWLLTLLCMTIFACNSIFCRAALVFCSTEAPSMGPLMYTAVRCLVAGAVLALLCLAGLVHAVHAQAKAEGQGRPRSVWQEALAQSSWSGALFLYLYMFCFSLAYVDIASAPGTLILNMCVQFAMVGFGMLHGLYPGRLEYAGLAVALAGLIALLSPGLTAPSPMGALLMAFAGFSWGAYSLCGRKVTDAGTATAGYFWRASLFALATLVFALIFESAPHGTAMLFAVAGGLASSLGYILWYAIVPRYSLTGSAVIQLSVPVLTALLGAFFLSEAITLRIVICSALVLGGICMALMTRKDRQK